MNDAFLTGRQSLANGGQLLHLAVYIDSTLVIVSLTGGQSLQLAVYIDSTLVIVSITGGHWRPMAANHYKLLFILILPWLFTWQ